MPTPDELLKGAALRNTAQRRSVLRTLIDHPHSTAADIAELLRGGDGTSLSHQGLYNVLDDLTRAGLVRRVEPAGSPAHFETRVGDNHHHLVCRVCSTVVDVDCAVGAAPCLLPVHDARAAGFAGIDEAEVTWWGTCLDCSTKQPQPAAPAAAPHDG